MLSSKYAQDIRLWGWKFLTTVSLYRWIHFQTVEEEVSAANIWGRPDRLPRRSVPARPAGAGAQQLRRHRGRQGDPGPAQVARRWKQRLLLRPDPPPEQIPAAADRNLFRVQVAAIVKPREILSSPWWRGGANNESVRWNPIVRSSLFISKAYWKSDSSLILFQRHRNNRNQPHTITITILCPVFSQWLNMLRKVKNVSRQDTFMTRLLQFPLFVT